MSRQTFDLRSGVRVRPAHAGGAVGGLGHAAARRGGGGGSASRGGEAECAPRQPVFPVKVGEGGFLRVGFASVHPSVFDDEDF